MTSEHGKVTNSIHHDGFFFLLWCQAASGFPTVPCGEKESVWAVDKVRIPPPGRPLVYRRARTKSLSALPLLVQSPLRALGANAGRKGAALSSLALMVSIKQLLNPGSFQIPISLTFSLWFGPSFAKYFTTRHRQAPELPLHSLDSFFPPGWFTSSSSTNVSAVIHSTFSGHKHT